MCVCVCVWRGQGKGSEGGREGGNGMDVTKCVLCTYMYMCVCYAPCIVFYDYILT